jgi:hypothetical protein
MTFPTRTSRLSYEENVSQANLLPVSAQSAVTTPVYCLTTLMALGMLAPREGPGADCRQAPVRRTFPRAAFERETANVCRHLPNALLGAEWIGTH